MPRITTVAKVVSDPDVEITIRMSLNDWRRLLDNLSPVGNFPVWKLNGVIRDTITALQAQVEKVYEDEH